MTDDPTRPIETPPPADTPAVPEPAAAPEPLAATPSAMDSIPAGSTGAAASSGGRIRWIIALGVAALAIVVAIGAILALGSQPTPEALKYIPGDAAVVAEVRMELPGDQMEKLGKLLAHFPGFLDQATLPDKIDEALSRLVSSSGAGGVDYRTDIKPWLSGPAFIGIRAPGGGAPASTSLNGVVISATTTGTVSCDAQFTKLTGENVSHERYQNLDLALAGGSACVIDGHQALIGDAQSVRNALDAHAGGTGIDRSEQYRAARGALVGDQLATVYLDSHLFSSMLPSASGAPSASGTPGAEVFAALGGALPAWTISGVRAEDDALVLDTISGPASASDAGATAGPSLLPLPAAHPSVIAPMAPADTILFAEDQGTGVTLQNLLTRLRTVPDLSAPLQMLDGVGGGAELVGWVEDVGVAVSVHGTTPDGVVFLVAKDDAAAADRVKTISGFLALAGLGGQGIEVHDSTVNGVTVTTVTITDVSQLFPPGSLPGGSQVPTTGPISFSIAAHGRAVVLTTGEGAMTAVLNVKPGESLVDQPRYKQALTRALASSRFSLFADVRAGVALVEALAPPDSLAQWQSSIKPYVNPIESLMISGSADASSGRSRFVITVSQPTQ
jgi:hypothetical protein